MARRGIISGERAGGRGAQDGKREGLPLPEKGARRPERAASPLVRAVRGMSTGAPQRADKV